MQVKQRIFDKGNAEGNDPPHLMLLTKAGTDNALYNDNYNEDNADDVESVPYLAALAGMNSIVEAWGLIPTYSAEHAIVPVKFWK